MECRILYAKDKPLTKEGKTTYPLYILVHWQNQQQKFYVGERVEIGTSAGQWDERAQKIAGKRNVPIELRNGKLQKKLQAIRDIFLEADVQGVQVTKEYLKTHYNARCQVLDTGKRKSQVKKEQNVSFTHLATEYQRRYRGRVSKETLRKCNQVVKGVEAFCPGCLVTQIDAGWFEEYVSYLIGEKELVNGTIGGHVLVLRAVMKLSMRLKIPVSGDWTEFKKQSAFEERVHLSWEELMQLYHYQPEINAKWSKPEGKQVLRGEWQAVQVFLFACFTGLRYKDVAGLKPENLHEDILSFVQHKTRQKNTLLLNHYAKTVLTRISKPGAKYLLPVITNYQTSQHVKAACRKCGITQSTERIRYSGANRLVETLPKWKLISFHVSRHTFATLSLKRGMDIVTLQDTLGHSDINSTRKYAKLADEDKYATMRRVWDEEK